MNGTKVVFDTNAAIRFLEKQYDLAALGINVDKVQFFTSIIVRMELLSKRQMLDDEKQKIIGFLNDLTVIPLTEEIEKKAIEIRRAASVKLPDCIVAATSIVLNAILLTDDHHLLNLSWSGLQTQKVI